jgi:hypothetical protein
MGRASRETWAKRVERWKDSGLTAKEFAAELGISAHSLSWWRWRLSSQSREPKPAARPHGAISKTTPSTASPTPLTFIEMTAPVAAEPLELVLPSSIRIRVPSSFEASTLGRLLDVLEQRR